MHNRSLVAAAAASVLLALPATEAAAQQLSSAATLTNFHVELVDLTPGDGSSPYIQWYSGTNSSAFTASYVGDDGRYDAQGGTDPFSPVSAAVNGPGSNAAASLTGDAYGAGATIAVSSSLDHQPAGQAVTSNNAYLSMGQYGLAGFSLSANTRLVISADATVSSAALPGAIPSDYTGASVWLQFGAGGGTSVATLSSSAGYGGNAEDTRSDHLTITFDNTTGSFEDGSFVGSVSAGSQTFPSAVPEPASAALMLAGLGAFALVRRRHRGA